MTLRAVAKFSASLLLAASACAQVTNQIATEPRKDSDPIVASIDGRSVPLIGLPSVSVPASTGQLTIGLTSEPGKRMRYRVEGIDQTWREGPGLMTFGVRFFDSNGDQIEKQSVNYFGQSAGWTGDLQRPAFVHRRKTFEAPLRARSFWIVLSSSGPPQTLGTLMVKGVIVSRLSDDGASEIILRAPVGRDSRVPVPGPPAPVGFCRDGLRPSMARLLSLAPTPTGLPSECFAIIDNDVQAHAEWHTIKEDALSVSAGERLVVEWDEAFSIGIGGGVYPTYKRPSAGSYHVRVQTVDLFGQPSGAESSLIIRVLAPWWQSPGVWILASTATIAGAFGIARYIANQRMQRQFDRLKAERLLEQERLRIARDIHDTLAQGLTGIIVQLEAAEDAQSRGLLEANTGHLRNASELARESLQEARRSVMALRPLALEQRDWPDALRDLIEKLTSGTPLSAELIVDGSEQKLPYEFEQNLLRITLEALTNALRHAHANRFIARLIFQSEVIRLELKDDGCGFDPSENHEGFGLMGMKERAEAMAGRLLVQSTLGVGTTISLVLPAIRRNEPIQAT